MARTPIEMPKLGYDMETGKVGGWLKRVGDEISRGDVIAEIETDKSTVEMEATSSGTLVEIVHDAGAEVAVGEPIAWLEDGSLCMRSGGPLDCRELERVEAYLSADWVQRGVAVIDNRSTRHVIADVHDRSGLLAPPYDDMYIALEAGWTVSLASAMAHSV